MANESVQARPFQKCPKCDEPAKRYSLEQLVYIYHEDGASRPFKDGVRTFKCVRCKKLVYIDQDWVLHERAADSERLRSSARLRATPVPRSQQGTVREDSVPTDSTQDQTMPPGEGGKRAFLDGVAAKVRRLVQDQIVLEDRFKLIKVLGTGAAGIVALCYDTYQDNAPVAAKFHLETAITGEDGQLPRDRVERVHNIQSMLNSPHTVKSLSILKTDDPCYITLGEYVDGISLGDIVDRHRALMRQISDLRESGERQQLPPIELVSEEMAITIGSQLSDLIAHARDRGRIVHRDIKPSNIMVQMVTENTSFPSGIRAILIDWGIARSNRHDTRRDGRALFDTETARLKADKVRATLTLAGNIIGTPHYMAPEQATGGRPDNRTDIYGLCATLYHIVTGQPPLDADNLKDLIDLIRIKDPVPAKSTGQSLGLKISDQFSAALAWGLQKDPADRPQTPEELKSALEACRLPATPAEPKAQPQPKTGRFWQGWFGT